MVNGRMLDISRVSNTYEFESSETLTGDLDWRFAELEEAKRRSEDEERRGENNENGLFKGNGKIKALATLIADNGPEGIVSAEGAAWHGVVGVHGVADRPLRANIYNERDGMGEKKKDQMKGDLGSYGLNGGS